jgi:hypothetical protein
MSEEMLDSVLNGMAIVFMTILFTIASPIIIPFWIVGHMGKKYGYLDVYRGKERE